MSTDDDAVTNNEPLNRAKETLRREAEELAQLDEIIEDAERKEQDLHRTEEL